MAILFTGHNPFVLWKMFSIEPYVIVAEYLIIFYLLLTRSIKITKKACSLILFIMLMVFPSQIFSGELREFGIILRILPVIIFVISYQNSVIFFKVFLSFFAFNFIVSAANYSLLKFGIPAQTLTIGELTGTTRFHLGFAVSTSFFETGNLLIARFQGYAWEPAPLGILCLISLITLRKIGLRENKSQTILIIFAFLFSKSIAAYLGALVYKISQQRAVIIWALILSIMFIILINYTTVYYFLIEKTSLLVRFEQSSNFLSSLTVSDIFFGSGYGVYDQHQTSIFTQWVKDFGFLRTIIAITFMMTLLKSRLGWSICLTIMLLFSSLNLAFSNYFIALISLLVFHGKKIS